MNKKVSLLFLSIVLAIIIFSASTYFQKQLVNYIPTMKCLVASNNIEEYSQLSDTDFVVVDMPLEIVSNLRIATKFDDISDLYLKSNLYKGQLILLDQFDTGDNLTIIRGEEGKEKIAIKIKSSENGVSYILKRGSNINVYATINNEYANSKVFEDYEKTSAGSNDYGYTTIKILNEVKILGCFDENGEEVEKMPEKNIDTILVSVTSDEAYKINLIRDFAVFTITEL